MMHWYCARLTPLRNTALGSGSFCNATFFSPKYKVPQRSESNNIGDWLIQSKERWQRSGIDTIKYHT